MAKCPECEKGDLTTKVTTDRPDLRITTTTCDNPKCGYQNDDIERF